METHPQSRKPYPTDATDEEWAFAAPYLTLTDEAAPQRRHDLREVFKALRWILSPARTSNPSSAASFPRCVGRPQIRLDDGGDVDEVERLLPVAVDNRHIAPPQGSEEASG